MNITNKFKDYDINCSVVQMGKDFNVSIELPEDKIYVSNEIIVKLLQNKK